MNLSYDRRWPFALYVGLLFTLTVLFSSKKVLAQWSLLEQPECVSWGPLRIDCFARGGDSAMYHQAWDGSNWSSWQPRGGVLLNVPECVSWGPNRIDCFARGGDSAMYHQAWDGSNWSGWGPLGELPGLICPMNDAALAIFDRDPAIPDVVERWAPVIYQDIDQSAERADLITMVEFDGNWLGADNAENRRHHPLPAVVYYSLVRTATHDFLGYYFYHVEDTSFGGHEHDLEGVVGAVNRCTAELEAILTNVHGPYVPYVSPWSLERIRVAKSHPGGYHDEHAFSLTGRTMTAGGIVHTYDTLAVGIEANTHAVWGRWHNECVVGPQGSPSKCDDSHGGDGIIYGYTGTAEVPQIFNQFPNWHEYGYQLRDMATLWSMAQVRTSCGQSEPTAIFACQATPPWDRFNARGADKGDLPWVWGTTKVIGHVCNGPNMLLDPAAIFLDWFQFPPDSFSATYKVHLYAASFTCP